MLWKNNSITNIRSKIKYIIIHKNIYTLYKIYVSDEGNWPNKNNVGAMMIFNYCINRDQFI